jgi:hypothetical protein
MEDDLMVRFSGLEGRPCWSRKAAGGDVLRRCRMSGKKVIEAAQSGWKTRILKSASTCWNTTM